MQNVRFQSVGELLDFLPPAQLEMVEILRELVYESVPGVQEHLSFNVPFFKLYTGLCFIWPGAVSWGSTVWEGVEFGFQNGYLLSDEEQYLDRGTRKQVFTKRFYSAQELRQHLGKLRNLLLEAAEVNELMQMEKSQRRKK